MLSLNKLLIIFVPNISITFINQDQPEFAQAVSPIRGI